MHVLLAVATDDVAASRAYPLHVPLQGRILNVVLLGTACLTAAAMLVSPQRVV